MDECGRCKKKTYGYDLIDWHPDFRAFLRTQDCDLICPHCQCELHWEFYNAQAQAETKKRSAADARRLAANSPHAGGPARTGGGAG